jgi:hypothetical protein
METTTQRTKATKVKTPFMAEGRMSRADWPERKKKNNHEKKKKNDLATILGRVQDRRHKEKKKEKNKSVDLASKKRQKAQQKRKARSSLAQTVKKYAKKTLAGVLGSNGKKVTSRLQSFRRWKYVKQKANRSGQRTQQSAKNSWKHAKAQRSL